MKCTIFIFCMLYFSCISVKNNRNEGLKQLRFEYLPVHKLSEIYFIKPSKNKDTYLLSFFGDSLPYVTTEDSLFRIKLNDDLFVLCYNSSLFRNTGFIVYCSLKHRKAEIITISKILNKTAYLIPKNNEILLKIEENLSLYAFDNPTITKNSFLLLSYQDFLVLKDICILSKGSVLEDNMKIILNDSVFNDKILIFGNVNEKQIYDTINITGTDFGKPFQIQNMQWNNMDVFEKQTIKHKSLRF